MKGPGSHVKEFGFCFMDKSVYQFPLAAVTTTTTTKSQTEWLKTAEINLSLRWSSNNYINTLFSMEQNSLLLKHGCSSRPPFKKHTMKLGNIVTMETHDNPSNLLISKLWNVLWIGTYDVMWWILSLCDLPSPKPQVQSNNSKNVKEISIKGHSSKY